MKSSEDERFAWALDSWILDGFGQTIAIGGQALQGWDYLPLKELIFATDRRQKYHYRKRESFWKQSG